MKLWPFVATWMELESVMLSEISHTEKNRYYMFSLLCGSSETYQKTMGGGEGKKKEVREGGSQNIRDS